MKNIILGAGGHAKEVLSVIEQSYNDKGLAFFDNTIEGSKKLFGFSIFYKNEQLKDFNTFFLGIGGIRVRKILSQLGLDYGLEWVGCRSINAQVGKYEVYIDKTVDLMSGVIISNSVSIGMGTLLNRNVNVHHDVTIGSFCEIAPGVQLLGKVKLGNEVFVGAGAILLPNVRVGNNAIIGAGAVVTKDIESGTTVAGIPAKIF
jgi:sugar O-acyltransferase (sialic acid O-acetyltransferase NeuD family)